MSSSAAVATEAAGGSRIKTTVESGLAAVKVKAPVAIKNSGGTVTCTTS